MGTNFYFCNEEGDELEHIGKRSAAGLFCWDCGISLNVAGNHAVHDDGGRILGECPICGKKPAKERLSSSSAGRELGFNKSVPKGKKGVRSCASFSWAISPGHFSVLWKASNLHVRDEYGRHIGDFSNVIKECPIMFFDSIGQEFS
jgi:hypothetical protein